jgi:hypothetical protein
MDHNWAQDRYPGLFKTETPTPGYTLFNVSAHTDLRYSKRQTMQIQHPGIFEMGRNLCIKIILNLCWKK